jgi:hypothetical protein
MINAPIFAAIAFAAAILLAFLVGRAVHGFQLPARRDLDPVGLAIDGLDAEHAHMRAALAEAAVAETLNLYVPAPREPGQPHRRAR